MDPLSIATGVGGLIDLCLKAGFAIKAAREGSKTVDAKIGLLDGEIRGYTQVLELMSSTLQDPVISSSFQSTGHIGNHWRSILSLIEDSSDTLERLNAVLRKVDKSVSVMDSTRKHFRMLFAAEEVDAYQKTIKTYRDTMQMSVQTIILWNQVSDRPAQVNMTVGLDDLTRLIRELAVDMNTQISGLRTLVQEEASGDRAQTLGRMKRCIETAADVVSSASTALGLDDTATVIAPSELGDIFGSRNDEAVMRWIDGSFQEIEAPTIFPENAPKEIVSDISTLSVDDSNSDDDMELELELIQAHQNRARNLIANRRLPEAIRVLERGIARIRKHEKHLEYPNLKAWFYSQLMKAYRKEKSWESLKAICSEYLEINSPNTAKHDSQQYHATMLNMAFAYGYLLDRKTCKAYLKRAMKGFMEMGEDGESSLLTSLRFMVKLCELDGESVEEEAYRLMHRDLKAKIDNREKGKQTSNGETDVHPAADQQETSTQSGPADAAVSPIQLSEFVNVHMVTAHSALDTYSREIMRQLHASQRLEPYKEDTKVSVADQPWLPHYELWSIISLKAPQRNTKLLFWCENLRSPPFVGRPLFEMSECTFTHIQPPRRSDGGNSRQERSTVVLKPTPSIPLCILIALRMIKVKDDYGYDFVGTFNQIRRYFYDPRYYSTPIILLTLQPNPSANLSQADREVPPSRSGPRWLRVDWHRPTRGYYKFNRYIKDYTGIREVFEFISGRSWEGKYFGPPQDPA